MRLSPDGPTAGNAGRSARRVARRTARIIVALLGAIVAVTAVTQPGAAADSAPAEEASAPRAGETKAAPDSGGASQSYLLRFRFAPNQFAHYETLHRSTLQVALQKVRQTTRHSSQTHKHFRVVTVHDDGSAILETQVDWAVLSAQNDDEPPVVFDSRRQGTRCPPVFRHVAESIGRPLARFTVTPLGLVRPHQTEARGGEHDSEGADTPGGPTFFIPLPQRPVQIGDRWEENFEVRVLVAQRFPQRVRLRRTFELVEVRDAGDAYRLAAHSDADSATHSSAVRPAAGSTEAHSPAGTRAPGPTADRRIAIIRGRTIVLSPVRDPAVAAQLAQREVSTEVHFDIGRGLIVHRTTKGDKLVVGPFGPASSIRAVMERVERLVPPPTAAHDQ